MADVDKLDRAVRIQGRLTSLAIQWHRTRDRRYREAALRNIEGMQAWMGSGQINLMRWKTLGRVRDVTLATLVIVVDAAERLS